MESLSRGYRASRQIEEYYLSDSNTHQKLTRPRVWPVQGGQMTSADNARKVRCEHHQRAIDRLVARYAGYSAFPALIIGGSIAKDDATSASDVDVMFVASDEEYRRR